MIFDDYYKLVLSIGAILIFLMAFFLWFYPRSFFANKVLGVLIFLWGYTVLIFVLQSIEFWARFPHLLGLGTSFVLLFFPLVYFYTKTYLYKDARKLRLFWKHMIPMLLYWIAFSPFYFQSGESKSVSILADGGIPHWVRNLWQLADTVIIIQGVFYTLISIRLLDHFQYFRGRRLTKVQNNAVHWLKQFIIINVLLWAVGAAGALLEILQFNAPFDLFKIYYLGLTGLTLWMGYFTLKKPHLFSEGQNIRTIVKNNGEEEGQQIDARLSADLRMLIEYLEKDKPYLNNELNLQNLSDRTGLTKHRISEIFNKALNKTFNDVINEYRTSEAIRLMNEGVHKQHTLTSLAEMAGFNSKATFNRIFKKNTGKTPSEYIQNVE